MITVTEKGVGKETAQLTLCKADFQPDMWGQVVLAGLSDAGLPLDPNIRSVVLTVTTVRASEQDADGKGPTTWRQYSHFYPYED